MLVKYDPWSLVNRLQGDLDRLSGYARRYEDDATSSATTEWVPAVDIKGGRAANTDGRLCLCNGLFASAGLAQYRVNSAYEEPALVTAGSDFRGVRELMRHVQPDEFYAAADVVDYVSGSYRAVT